MLIRRIIDKRKPYIKLMRVGETDSKRTWIFTFIDPIHKFMQSIIMAKDCPGEAMEASWEDLHTKWAEQIREVEWKAGVADFN